MENCVIKTIIFDMGGVIFHNGTRKAIDFLMFKYNVEEYIAKDIYSGPLSWDLRIGKLTSDDYWLAVKRKYDKCDFIKSLNLKELWYDQFTPICGMLELINSLKGNFRLGIISGNIVDRVEYLFNKYNFEKYFDFQGYSFMYNLHKNDPKLYRKVINEFNIDPNSVLFIDDNADCLEAAKCCGFNTYLFANINELKRELKIYGI